MNLSSSQAPHASSPGSTKIRTANRTLIIVIAAVLLTVLMVGGGLLLKHLRSDTKQTEEPRLTTTVDLSSLGEKITAKPLRADGAAVMSHNEIHIARMAHSTGEALVAIDATSTTGHPKWITPLPTDSVDTPLDCRLSDETVDCGDGISVDMATGMSKEHVTEQGSSPHSQETTGTTSARLEATPTDKTPLSIDDSGHVSSDGTEVTGLQFAAGTPVWAAKAVEKDGLWVLSDGAVLAGVKDGKQLWGTSLPENSAEINGLGTGTAPHWIASADAVVFASPNGIHAVDPVKGKDIWTIDTPVTSWVGSTDAIVVVNGTMASVLGANGSKSADGTPAPPSTTSTIDLANTTLDVPEKCAQVFGSGAAGQGNSVTFANGMVKGDAPSGGGAPGAIQMMETHPALLSGKPASVVLLNCNGGGNYSLSSLAAYDTEAHLLGALDLEWLPHFAHLQEFQIDGLSVVGGTINFKASGLQLLGDKECNACRGSGTADISAAWNGQEFVTTDVVFHTPAGDVRVPKTTDVQTLYDAVASGDDNYAATYMSPQLIASLGNAVGSSGRETKRSVHFAEGNHVLDCSLAGPTKTASGSSGKVEFPGGNTIPIASSSAAHGDLYCPVVASGDNADNWAKPMPNTAGGVDYTIWLVLSGQPDGSFQVKELGRFGG